MQLTPVRAFALGVASVLVIAGTFVAGIGIGSGGDPDIGEPVRVSNAAVAHTVSCPAPPDEMAPRREHQRALECEMALQVENVLLATGVESALVQVHLTPGTELLGPDTTTNVNAQVVPPRGLLWDADAAAIAIARSVGTSPDRVAITDEQLRSLTTAPTARGPVATAARPARVGRLADVRP